MIAFAAAGPRLTEQQTNKPQTMKKTIALCAALLAGCTAFAAEDAVKEESTYAVTLDFPYVSKYVFRGLQIARDSLQPSVEVSAGGLYLGAWGNVPLRHENDLGASKELDLYLGYTPKLTENLSADVGVTYYSYPRYDGDGADDSTEIFAGLNLTLGNFTPAAYIYRDIDLESTALQTSVGYSLPLKSIGTSLDFNATVGVVIPDVGETYCYYAAGVNMPYKLSDTVKLNVGLTYTENDLDHGKDPGLWGTAGITASF